MISTVKQVLNFEWPTTYDMYVLPYTDIFKASFFEPCFENITISY